MSTTQPWGRQQPYSALDPPRGVLEECVASCLEMFRRAFGLMGAGSSERESREASPAGSMSLNEGGINTKPFEFVLPMNTEWSHAMADHFASESRALPLSPASLPAPYREVVAAVDALLASAAPGAERVPAHLRAAADRVSSGYPSRPWLASVGPYASFVATVDGLYGGAPTLWDVVRAFLAGPGADGWPANARGASVDDRRVFGIGDRTGGKRYSVLYCPVEAPDADGASWGAEWIVSVATGCADVSKDLFSKFLVPRVAGDASTLDEVGKVLEQLPEEAHDELRRAAATMCFWLLLLGDAVMARAPCRAAMAHFHAVVAPNFADEQRRAKAAAVGSMLSSLRPLVVALQESPDVYADGTDFTFTHAYRRHAEPGGDAAVLVHPSLASLRVPLGGPAGLGGELERLGARCAALAFLPEGLGAAAPEALASVPALAASVHMNSKAKPKDTVAVLRCLYAAARGEAAATAAREAGAGGEPGPVGVLWVGMDCNSDVLPGQQRPPTTLKMRSFLQMQIGKAHKLVADAKDAILCIEMDSPEAVEVLAVAPDAPHNSAALEQLAPRAEALEMLEGRAFRASGVGASTALLPSPGHPFDHYALCCGVNVPPPSR